MDGMVFDAGTWWLITICVTALITLIGALVSRSVFKQLDKNGADIKDVRESYIPRKEHSTDMEKVRSEMKDMRKEMRSEITAISDNVKDIKGNCIRREEFLQSQLKLENKLDKLMDYIMRGGR